ncbi:gustatory receptor for bitter taste 93a [Drosophila tropicalis]|uniref:gustatory receptor for bitter taste 93a n=1 Tax=Drosophila tropicalis TaxID=46794 RepID=UPI0035ABF905
MSQYSQNMDSSRLKGFSRTLLLGIYYVARGLSLLSCNLDREQLLLRPIQRRSNKVLAMIWRSIIVLIYWSVIPTLFYQFVQKPKSYADLFALLQSSSVSILAVTSFIIQASREEKFIAILNRYLELYRQICLVTKSNQWQMFAGKFVILYALKVLLTLFGCVHEVAPLLQVQSIVQINVTQTISVIFGIYMWFGTLFLLDACFLGFLVAGIFYEHMAMHIRTMLQRMRPIEFQEEDFPSERMTHYKRMCLLCDFTDELDSCGSVYSELYDVTLSFRRILQWQIGFYIYYNFCIICLMLYQCILLYLSAEEMVLLTLTMVGIKLANLILLIMCADYTVNESRKPLLMPLDIVCTDIDQRWDKSVETFLSQQQTQNLEIKVLGFFALNNRFILIVLSAIISYLFILIQFGLSGGFENSKTLESIFNKTTIK